MVRVADGRRSANRHVNVTHRRRSQTTLLGGCLELCPGTLRDAHCGRHVDKSGLLDECRPRPSTSAPSPTPPAPAIPPALPSRACAFDPVASTPASATAVPSALAACLAELHDPGESHVDRRASRRTFALEPSPATSAGAPATRARATPFPATDFWPPAQVAP